MDRVTFALNLLVQSVGTTLQSAFADPLVLDDRHPVYTYRYNDTTTWVLLSPKWELWKQLVFVSVVLCGYSNVCGSL